MKESKKSRTSTSIRVDSHSTEYDRKSNQYSILIHKHNMKKVFLQYLAVFVASLAMSTLSLPLL